MRTVEKFPTNGTRRGGTKAAWWDDIATRLRADQVLAFDRLDFDGKEPQKFRANAVNVLRHRGIRVSTVVKDDVLYLQIKKVDENGQEV